MEAEEATVSSVTGARGVRTVRDWNLGSMRGRDARLAHYTIGLCDSLLKPLAHNADRLIIVDRNGAGFWNGLRSHYSNCCPTVAMTAACAFTTAWNLSTKPANLLICLRLWIERNAIENSSALPRD